MAEVHLQRVSKSFSGGVCALDSVDLHIQNGEMVVLIGPSGCGKTTSLRLIAGLESVDNGTIRIARRIVNNVSPKQRDVAMVFQNSALYSHMSVYQNMAFGLKMRHVKKAEIAERIQRASETLGIADLLDRRPKALSGGQRQRVAVGRALVRRPNAFLFDEPFSNLDARLRVQTRTELKQLHRRLGTTMLYVTHDQEEAMTLGDRVAVIDRGRVQQFDTPREVYNQPANRFVAGFLGMPPMNFLDGTLRQFQGQTWFVGAGARLPITADLAPPAAQRLDKPVVLGIRPEALCLDEPSSNGTHLRLKIHSLESAGNTVDVFATTPDGTSVVTRATIQANCHVNQVFVPRLDPSGVHLFEPGEHGANLALTADTATPSRSDAACL